ncbi:MAG: SNF2-related protein, partial [Terriglobales bacterium]
MHLEFYEKTGNFGLRVNKAQHDAHAIMRDHGWNLNVRQTTVDEAHLWTDTPYAAAHFFKHATPEAAAQLAEMQAQIDASWSLGCDAHIKCPPDQELTPFQKAGVAYALGRRNTLIGDQPGLGKTMQAICYANEIGARRVLVLCPAAIRLQWVARIRTWTTMRWPFTVYPILSSRHGVHPDAQWTVVSYDLARTPAIWKALVECRPYDLLIIDEGHNLKTIE